MARGWERGEMLCWPGLGHIAIPTAGVSRPHKDAAQAEGTGTHKYLLRVSYFWT